MFKLSPTPIANRLPRSLSIAKIEKDKKIPLTLLSCADCEHVQLGEVVSPTILFDDYPYMSVSNKTMRHRLEQLSEMLIRDSKIESPDSILEIGSNDGALLLEFQRRGFRVLGIDPAQDIAAKAQDSGIRTIPSFFSSTIVNQVVEEIGIPRIIIANNVLAHSNELRDIFRGLSMLMDKDTNLYVEFSYLLDVLNKVLVDTIYHEHTSYHHLKPLYTLLKEFGLKVVQVHRFEAHGGSLRIQITREESSIDASSTVNELLQTENQMSLNDFDSPSWIYLRKNTEVLSNRLSEILTIESIQNGAQLSGYGISAKFSTLYYGLGLDSFLLSGFYDDNPMKIGRFAPGTLKMIESTAKLHHKAEESIFLFAWNYKEEVVSRLKTINPKNKIIVPLPKTEVIL